MKLNRKDAENAIKKYIADPLGISVLSAAWAIHEVVTENMSQAASIHTLEKGRKVENFSMIPIGGAGPVHACSLMSKMNVNEMISPPNAGVASAIGMVASPNSFELVQADMQLLEDLNFSKMKKLFKSMREEGMKSLKQTGTNLNEIKIMNSVLMRYVGQGYEVEVPLDKENLEIKKIIDIKMKFEKVYQNLFRRIERMPLEIISWRTIASGPMPELKLKTIDKDPLNKNNDFRKRKVFFGGNNYINTSVISRYELTKNFQEKGPLVIEERESTLIIPPGFNVKFDQTGSLLINRVNR